MCSFHGRRWTGVAMGALALGVTLAAVTSPTITFTDTKLSNGLRVVIAEDHTAPVFSIAVNTATAREIVVVQNWLGELKRLVPTK